MAENVAAPFDPRVTIGTELRGAGYHTAFVGKYLNGLRDEVKPHQLKRYAKGWDDFDIIYENNGKFFDYTMWSPDGGRQAVRRRQVRPQHAGGQTQAREGHQGSTGRPAAVRLRQHLRPA